MLNLVCICLQIHYGDECYAVTSRPCIPARCDFRMKQDRVHHTRRHLLLLGKGSTQLWVGDQDNKQMNEQMNTLFACLY